MGGGGSKNKAEGSQVRAKYTTEVKIEARKASDSTHPTLRTGVTENGTNNENQGCQVLGSDHEKG